MSEKLLVEITSALADRILQTKLGKLTDAETNELRAAISAGKRSKEVLNAQQPETKKKTTKKVAKKKD